MTEPHPRAGARHQFVARLQAGPRQGWRRVPARQGQQQGRHPPALLAAPASYLSYAGRPVRRRTDVGRDAHGVRRTQEGRAQPRTAAEGVRHPRDAGFPEAEQAEEEHEGKKGRPPLPYKMVDPDDLRPVTRKTREELRKALVQRLYGRRWDKDTADPSPFRDAAVLLTPSHKDLEFHKALCLTASDAEYLGPNKASLAPTLDEEVESKLNGCWADIAARASEAARKEFSTSLDRLERTANRLSSALARCTPLPRSLGLLLLGGARPTATPETARGSAVRRRCCFRK